MDKQAHITPNKGSVESPKPDPTDKAIAAASLPPDEEEEDVASISYLGSSQSKDKTTENTLTRLLQLLEVDVSNDPYNIGNTLKILFRDYGINSFTSLAMMTEDDLKNPGDGLFVGAFKSILFRRKFLTLLAYCRLGLTIRPDMDFNAIIQGVSLPPYPPQTAPTPPVAFAAAKKDNTPKISFDKDFLAFSGSDKTWKSWKRSVINATGVAGGKQYLTVKRSNSNVDSTEDQLCDQLFYRLKQALQNGSASMFADALEQEGNCCPATLWEKLNDHYEHEIAKEIQVVEATRELLQLTLDDNISASSYIQKFTTYVGELEKTASL
jgi:hypothetical protein